MAQACSQSAPPQESRRYTEDENTVSSASKRHPPPYFSAMERTDRSPMPPPGFPDRKPPSGILLTLAYRLSMTMVSIPSASLPRIRIKGASAPAQAATAFSSRFPTTTQSAWAGTLPVSSGISSRMEQSVTPDLTAMSR